MKEEEMESKPLDLDRQQAPIRIICKSPVVTDILKRKGNFNTGNVSQPDSSRIGTPCCVEELRERYRI